MTARQRHLYLGLCIGALLISGCESGDMSDLERYSAEVLSRQGGQIEPLPPIKPYEPYLYESAERGLRDPFRSYVQAERERDVTTISENPEQERFTDEILTHLAEELENYPLDSLRMVGIMEDQADRWGIVRDPTGTIHRVRVGNYLGANFGKIMAIDETHIELREIFQDTEGRWEERAAALALTEE